MLDYFSLHIPKPHYIPYQGCYITLFTKVLLWFIIWVIRLHYRDMKMDYYIFSCWSKDISTAWSASMLLFWHIDRKICIFKWQNITFWLQKVKRLIKDYILLSWHISLFMNTMILILARSWSINSRASERTF